MARPRKADALDLRRLAVNAAIGLLSGRAQPDLSMAEIARAIGCSAPALYTHFTDKQGLLDAVRREVVAQQTAQKKSRYGFANTDPLRTLAEGGHAYLRRARASPAIYRLIYCMPPRSPSRDAAESVDKAISDGALQALSDGVRACQAAGYAKAHDAEDVARLLWSMVHGAVLFALDSSDAQADEMWRHAHGSVDTVIAMIEKEIE